MNALQCSTIQSFYVFLKIAFRVKYARFNSVNFAITPSLSRAKLGEEISPQKTSDCVVIKPANLLV